MRSAILSAGLIALALAACSGPKTKLDKCHKAQEYQAANVAPRLRVPDDLVPLDDNVRLQVPFGERQTEPTDPSQPCLVEPPDYQDRSVD